jgi:hypothetical protein
VRGVESRYHSWGIPLLPYNKAGKKKRKKVMKEEREK